MQPVLSALTDTTGLALLAALLAGDRDPHKLAEVRDFRIKASAATLAQALVGDWRAEPLLTMPQALWAYRPYQPLIAECAQESERLLAQFDFPVDPTPVPLPPATTAHRQPQRNEIRCPHTDLRTALYRRLAVDLTQGPGLPPTTLLTLFTALGPERSAFPTPTHFASWLGLCPDTRLRGGRVLSAKTRTVKSRAADARRRAAHSLPHSHSMLGDFYRRRRARLGAPQALTATAHQLARILYQLLTTSPAYDESAFAQSEQRYRQRRLPRLQREAAALGSSLAPQGSVS